MLKKLATSLLLVAAFAASCFGQCNTIQSARPRIYLPNTAYGSYATVLALKQAQAAANTTEWQHMYSQGTTYLTTQPSSGYYDAAGMEEALIYQINTTTYASYGARAAYFLNLAVQTIAPTVDITAASSPSGGPTTFTTASPYTLVSGNKGAIWGGTGSWAVFNSTAPTQVITQIDSTHFSIAVDSSTFGALPSTMTVSANNFTELNQARWDTPMIAAIWDWIHPILSSNLTSDQLNQIENVMAAATSWVAANPYGWSSTTDPVPTGGIGNLNIGPINGALQMAVAFSGDTITGYNSQTVCSTIRGNFLYLAPAYTTGQTIDGTITFPLAVGAAYVESTEYSSEVQFFLMCYLEVLLGATGENEYADVGTFPTAVIQYHFSSTSPGNASSGGNWGEMMPYGDIESNFQHVRTLAVADREIMQQDALYLCGVGADSTNCAYAEYWLQNVFTETQGATQGNVGLAPSLVLASEFLYYDPTLTATNPWSTYGLDYLATGDGELTSRSSTSTSATWVGFKGGVLRGSDEDHTHSDILSFQIYRNGDWLTNNLLFYSGNYDGKLARWNNVPLVETNQYSATSPYHAYEGCNPPSRPNNGPYDWGQTGMTVQGKVTQYEFNSTLSYAYAEANALDVCNGIANPYTTPAYTPQMSTVIRDFLYLKPDTYVMEDRLAYTTPLQAEDNIQALANPGTPSGSNFTLGSLLGNNQLNVAIISLASPSISVVSSTAQATENGCTINNGCPPQWRVQVTSGNSVMGEQYFFVMQSGATGFTPLTVTTLTGTNAIAAQFTGYVVGGPPDTSQTGVTRSYTFTNSGAIQHIFFGLKPSTVYKVDTTTVSGTATISDAGTGSSVTSSTGGVLLFTTNSGAGTPATQYTPPSPLSFGSQTTNCGGGCPTLSTTLTNIGTATLTGISIAMQTGTQYSQTNTCAATLAVNATCVITATFDPTTIGLKNDNIQVTSNAPTSVDNISVSGTGVVPPTILGSAQGGAKALNGAKISN